MSAGGPSNGGSYYGKGRGSAVLSQLSCPENSSELSSCQFSAIPARYCSFHDNHDNDAGVSCIGIHLHHLCVFGLQLFFFGSVSLCDMLQVILIFHTYVYIPYEVLRLSGH